MSGHDSSNVSPGQSVSEAPTISSGERLWTPWRMRYVGGTATESGCIFCNRLAGDDDVQSLLLHRGERAFVIMNLFPYNTGHVMIVPNAHVATPEQADDDTLASVGQLLRPALRALRRAMSCDGFNVGFNVGAVAGAGVADHLHQHVVPRWTGDANFMPILASTMVLPELIPVTYAKIRAELAREFTPRSASADSIRLVIVDETATNVALSENDGHRELPRVAASPDQPFAKAAADLLATEGIDAVLAGWAGPRMSGQTDKNGFTYIATSTKETRSLSFVSLADARSDLEGTSDLAVLDRAIAQFAPGVH